MELTVEAVYIVWIRHEWTIRCIFFVCSGLDINTMFFFKSDAVFIFKSGTGWLPTKHLGVLSLEAKSVLSDSMKLPFSSSRRSSTSASV